MKRIVVPTKSGADWKRLLAKPDLHWKPGKSAMSVAASWEAAGDRFPSEVSTALAASKDPDLANLELLLAVPEWEVELPGAVTTSHTDVMALAGNVRGLVAVAVEAKVDEEFGPTLGEKRAAPSSGQAEPPEVPSCGAATGRAAAGSDSISIASSHSVCHSHGAALSRAGGYHACTVVQSCRAVARRFSDVLSSSRCVAGVRRCCPSPSP